MPPVALAAPFFPLSTMSSTAFAGLVVLAILVAFVVLAIGAGAPGFATAPRGAVTDLRAVLLLRAASAFGALAVFFFRICTVVGFLSVFLRAAALLFEVSARAVVLALF
ncbi:MAG: hypothetical protein JO004_11160 [Methylobacteriaceae bacterium]|nr:hypothetical protein [Methylobacteriaceae bacterium]